MIEFQSLQVHKFVRPYFCRYLTTNMDEILKTRKIWKTLQTHLHLEPIVNTETTYKILKNDVCYTAIQAARLEALQFPPTHTLIIGMEFYDTLFIKFHPLCRKIFTLEVRYLFTFAEVWCTDTRNNNYHRVVTIER